MGKSFFSTPIGQHGRHISIGNLKKSWSKWGGINLGIEKRTPEWMCQICGEIQPKAIDPFIFPMTDREFLRICSACEHTKIVYGFQTFEIMIIVRRKPDPDL